MTRPSVKPIWESSALVGNVASRLSSYTRDRRPAIPGSLGFLSAAGSRRTRARPGGTTRRGDSRTLRIPRRDPCRRVLPRRVLLPSGRLLLHHGELARLHGAIDSADPLRTLHVVQSRRLSTFRCPEPGARREVSGGLRPVAPIRSFASIGFTGVATASSGRVAWGSRSG